LLLGSAPPLERIGVACAGKLLCLLICGLSGVVRQPVPNLQPLDARVAISLRVSANLEQEFGSVEIALDCLVDEDF